MHVETNPVGRAAVALVTLLLGLAGRASAAAPAFVRDATGFVVHTPVYTAHVSGATGLLDQLDIGNAPALDGTSIDLANRPVVRVDTTQPAPSQVEAYFSAREADGKVVEKALQITYTVRDDSTLEIRTLSTVGQVSGKGMRFELSHTVQLVRSLDFKEAVPVPVLETRTPWMRVKYTFSSGASLGILNDGPGNPFNPNENGGVSGYEYARGGYVANSPYTYTLVAAVGKARVLGAPAMEVVEERTPAAYFVPQTPPAPVVATLRIHKANYAPLVGRPGLRVKAEVEDFTGSTVAQSEMPLDLASGADPLEVKVPLRLTKLGWYRAYFTVQDATNSLLEGKERLIFSVLRRLPDMGERFDNLIQTDYTLGLGLTREDIGGRDAAGLKQLSGELKDETAGTDVRVTYALAGPPPQVGNNPARFGEYLQTLFTGAPGAVPGLEIINEPNGTLQPREYVDTFLRPAHDAIKAASPQTRVMGPVLVGIGQEARRYLQDLYRLGLKDLVDELTFHPYAGNFDDGAAVESMEALQQTIALNGDAGKPISFTEAGYGHGGWSDLPALREVIKLLISQYVWQHAVMGIDYRHNFYYFTDQMGYLDFWLRSNHLTPAAVALRTYVGLVKGLNRPRRMDFGSLEDVRAFVFEGPNRQVVALWTSSNNDPVTSTPITFKTSARAVEWTDCFGNVSTLPVNDGHVRLNAGTFPSYLVLPAGATITPEAERWGADLALSSLGAVAESSSEEGIHPAALAIDGDFASGASWRSERPNDLPQTLTVRLAGPATIDRVGLWSYSARGYDIEVHSPAGKWSRVVSRRDQPARRFRDEAFPAAVADAVRLTVLDTNGDHAEVAELQVFSPGTAAGHGVDLVNWALASRGSTARASSVLTKDVTVAQQDYGAQKPRILQLHVETSADHAIDGKRLVNDWRDFYPTTWMAAPGAQLPQWLEVDFAAPHPLTSIAVYTIAFASWTPAESGIRDWDVQVWQNGDWHTIDHVTGNTRVSHVSPVPPGVVTERIRILVRATNDPEGTVGIMEAEAFGPAGGNRATGRPAAAHPPAAAGRVPETARRVIPLRRVSWLRLAANAGSPAGPAGAGATPANAQASAASGASSAARSAAIPAAVGNTTPATGRPEPAVGSTPVLVYPVHDEGSIMRWLCISPLRYDAAYIGDSMSYDVFRANGGSELSARPRAGETLQGFTWKKMSFTGTTEGPTMCSLFDVAGHTFDYGLTLCAVYVYSPRERPDAVFSGSSDDGLKVVLNGQKIWVNQIQRSPTYDSDQCPAPLHQGWNALLCAVDQVIGGHLLTARFLDHGQPVTDLLISLDPPAPGAERLDAAGYNAAALQQIQVADALRARGDLDGAAAAYRKVVAGYPLSDSAPRAAYAVAQALYSLSGEPSLKRPQEASDALRLVIDRYPADALAEYALLDLGRLQSALHQPALAEQEFRTFETRYPHSLLAPKALLARAQLLADQQKYEDAVLMYHRVAREYPESDEVLLATIGVGDAYRAAGKPFLAREAYAAAAATADDWHDNRYGVDVGKQAWLDGLLAQLRLELTAKPAG